MIDFGLGQGPIVFCNRRHNTIIPRIAEKRERSTGSKDAVSGWTLTQSFKEQFYGSSKLQTQTRRYPPCRCKKLQLSLG
jgi:hypothetical protein